MLCSQGLRLKADGTGRGLRVFVWVLRALPSLCVAVHGGGLCIHHGAGLVRRALRVSGRAASVWGVCMN